MKSVIWVVKTPKFIEILVPYFVLSQLFFKNLYTKLKETFVIIPILKT